MTAPDIIAANRTLTLTVGIPASGKTTWALAAGFDCEICLDDCRKKLWGDPGVQDGPGGLPVLLEFQAQEIRAAMRENKRIVVHNTNILKAHRLPIIEMAKAAGYHVRIVFFDVPVEECIWRNKNRDNPVPEAVIRQFHEALEVPEPD
ncbi:MAG: ATP-binding protein [Deltaproteobacteria bacterium]|nr:ATP-binding protein [Deltaproteobacteria bacterium]